jgi:Tat protein translocase TatC
MLTATIRLSMMGGVVASIPMLVLGAYRLVRPLLGRSQRRFAVLFLPAILLSYVGGMAFAYFVLLPTGLRFLLHFGTNIATPTIRISEYLALVMAMLFWLGIVFELPLAMFLLAKLRLVPYRKFKKLRKFVPATAFVLSAIITPTFDVVNQLLVAIPLIVLYEVGLALAWLAMPGKGIGMNPLRWILIRNVWTLVWAAVFAVVYAAVGPFLVVLHVGRVAWKGKITAAEQAAVVQKVRRYMVEPYFRLLRRVGVEVE